ncbi:MAG: plasmid maintenance system killer [Armatimonadetes bacterium]|nr:plasmid maintenance system killer [Armatimonadota bacterium]NIO55181.1 plasmid maintenance system killer [Candidatus Latescibacterota bacterium]NIM23047.1 plasmid maintenance system killer [Armatimonadota bacterium]NIM66915.1 plasmid maintenance system killer [Armatimonadota bacterium]NIM75449.1 plasmid maintenance system killer [Armatimonadota bacterium]
MYIRFRTRKLEKCYLSHRKAAAAWGKKVADKYVQRVDILKVVEKIEDLHSFPPLRFHALGGYRKGEYAVDLTERYRLIFTLEGDAPMIICVEEVSKHYGD